MSSKGEPLPPHASSVAWLESQLQRLAGHLLFVSSERAFLEPQARMLVGDAVNDPVTLRARLAEEDARLERDLASGAREHPLAQLIAKHALSRLESDLLLFALLPELDDRFGEIFFAPRGAGLTRRPTFGVALRALLDDRADRWEARRHLAGSALWEAGMLRRDAEDRSGLELILVPGAPVVASAHGQLPEHLDGGARVELLPPSEHDVEQRPALAALVNELSGWIEAVQVGVVHLIAEAPDDARSIPAALSRAFGIPLLRVSGAGAHTEGALREAALCSIVFPALLIVEIERGVDVVRAPTTWNPRGPVLILTAPGCEVHLPPALPARRIVVPRARPAEQVGVWQGALREVNGVANVNLLAARTHLTRPEIRGVTTLAAQRAKVAGRDAPRHDDVVDALAEIVPDPVSSLARTTRPRVPWTKLVLDRETRASLEDLVIRVEHRVTVQDRWGMAGDEGRGEGLVALFHGDSGTGKTLAAEAVAARLGMPMMRIDLSRVVSKYIGETEKHLGGLFDAAEGFRLALFFDEADALFGSRTGVKDANDRYANLETNYLLARLEAFEGIAVLATNLLRNIDDAFTRRLQLIIHFPRPTPSLQQKLWTLHLPLEQLAPDVDLELITRQYDLVGGEIRNAALTAAYAAAAAGTTVSAAMMDQAVRAERLKRGKAVRRGGDS